MLCVLKRDKAGITVNDAHIRTVDFLHAGDRLALLIPDDDSISVSAPVKMPLDILFEDDDLILINKPAGLAMHETHNHQGDALSNALAFYLTEKAVPRCFARSGGSIKALRAL